MKPRWRGACWSPPNGHATYVQPDYGRLHQVLPRKGVTLMLLWEEYRADHADRQTYAYSLLCNNYRRFARQPKRSMRKIHRAGEKLFIDYTDPTIGLTDGSRAHITCVAGNFISMRYVSSRTEPLSQLMYVHENTLEKPIQSMLILNY